MNRVLWSDVSDDETPREYDREYTAFAPGPVRKRTGRDIERDEVARFVVQLEYHHDGDWHPVVRYDHDGTGESDHAHDSEQSPTVHQQVRTIAREPMTDEQIEALRDAIEEQREQIREDLTADLGGDPEDYRADCAVADGSGDS